MLTDIAFEKQHNQYMAEVHGRASIDPRRIVAEERLRDLELSALLAAPLETATEDVAAVAQFIASGH